MQSEMSIYALYASTREYAHVTLDSMGFSAVYSPITCLQDKKIRLGNAEIVKLVKLINN